MNAIDTQRAFENFILTRWLEWKPSKQQIADWLSALQRFDYESIKFATSEYVQAYEMFSQPKLNLLMKLLYKQAEKRPKVAAEQPRPYLLYEITSGGRSLKFYASTKRNIDETALLNEAEEYRIQCGLLYGGNEWTIVRHWDKQKTEF